MGPKNVYWRTVESRFNDGGFSPTGDGVAFADKVHFTHTLFDDHYETINPSTHGQLLAQKLYDMWKTIWSDMIL